MGGLQGLWFSCQIQALPPRVSTQTHPGSPHRLTHHSRAVPCPASSIKPYSLWPGEENFPGCVPSSPSGESFISTRLGPRQLARSRDIVLSLLRPSSPLVQVSFPAQETPPGHLRLWPGSKLRFAAADTGQPHLSLQPPSSPFLCGNSGACLLVRGVEVRALSRSYNAI